MNGDYGEHIADLAGYGVGEGELRDYEVGEPEPESDNESNETGDAWFCNYESIDEARKVAAKMNDLAKQMRKLHDEQPAHLRDAFGYGTMNCGLYDYSAGPPVKMHKDITDEWGGLYRTLRLTQSEQPTTAKH